MAQRKRITRQALAKRVILVSRINSMLDLAFREICLQ